MDHRYGKIAQRIIELQNEDGTWGNEFHCLSIPNSKNSISFNNGVTENKHFYLPFLKIIKNGKS